MKYESLRKLYYKDPKLYQQEYDSRWNGRAAIHIDFDVSGKFGAPRIPRQCLIRVIISLLPVVRQRI